MHESSVPWWRHAVVYEVYVRSFADSDGDGIGDLRGIRDRLPHIRDLGASAVWLTPFYPSPQEDGGYDVADYRDVDPLFGSLADFDDMMDVARACGLRVIVDLVPNHTSAAHEWFAAALAAGPASRERERYMFAEGRGDSGELPPNNWQSNFGGPAWSRVTDGGVPGQWYLHLFAPGQPDLNWRNEEVRDEFDSILRFWLDRGVDGFRIDVAHGLLKDPRLPDLAAANRPPSAPAAPGAEHEDHPFVDQEGVHEIYRRWRLILDSYPGERVFVAEAWVDTPARLARYLRPDELHTAFNFDFLLAPWDPHALKDVIVSTVDAHAAVGAPPTWVLSNHDVVRHVTRYGGGDVGTSRARAASLLMFALPGGAYIYQGEELGLPEVVDLPDDARLDPTFSRTGGAQKGRDGCRVPLPWSGGAPPFGFSPAGSAWLPQPSEWISLTVERQAAESDSMLSLYRSALGLRRRALIGIGESLQWCDSEPTVLAFTRGEAFGCVVNLGADAATIPPAVLATGEVLLTSGALTDARAVPPDTAIWFGRVPSS